MCITTSNNGFPHKTNQTKAEIQELSKIKPLAHSAYCLDFKLCLNDGRFSTNQI